MRPALDRPRNLLLRNRPLRQALLLDLEEWPASELKTDTLLDEFVRRSHEHWDGLATPLILHRKGEIVDHDWQLLRLSDPDAIQSASILPEHLIRRLDEELAPTHIDIARVHEGRASFESNGLPIILRNEVLETFPDRQLLVFDLHAGHDPLVRRFLERNFGTFEQWTDTHHPEKIRRLAGIERRLAQIPHEPIAISDRISLARFLDLAAGSRPMRGMPYNQPRPFVALCELSGRPNPYGALHGYLEREYLVYVGDSPADFAAFWNTAQWSLNLASPYRHQLWLPDELAAEASIRDSLNNWLRYHTGWGNRNPKGIAFASESLSAEALQPIAEAICTASPSTLPFRVLTREQLDEFRVHSFQELDHKFRMAGTEPDAYRRVIHGNHGVVDVPFPTPFGIPKPEGTWMVDAQVEQLAPDLARRNPPRSWLLPRRASRMVQQMFKTAARVDRTGIFSVEMAYSTLPFGHRAKPELQLGLPDEGDVVSWMLRLPRLNWHLPKDPRAGLQDDPFPIEKLPWSDKGRYMDGLLRLFGGLSEAEGYLSRPFWQRLFRELADLDPHRDEELITRTQNLLKKKLRELKPTDKQLASAAKAVATFVGGRVHGQYRTLEYCECTRAEMAASATPQEEFAAGETRHVVINRSPLSNQDMLEEFEGLTSRRILRLGAALTCRRCGLPNWHPFPLLKETITCPGCDSEIVVPFNQALSVELNSLAKMAVIQGALGVIQATSGLAQMAESFFFSPSFEIYRPGDKTSWHEADVAAIVDGEFVIGEVKERALSTDDFDGLVEMAEALRPAKAILFINKEEWSDRLKEPFERARARLATKRIALEVHHLVFV